MGLSDGRRKQRLVGSARTRNAAWSNDASLPGQRLLASMGWAAGQGIGRTQDGRADPVKVAFKLDNRGIGAQRAEREARASGKADAWIGGNGELGSLFERLNKAGDAEECSLPVASSSQIMLDAGEALEASAKAARKAERRRKRGEKEQRRADRVTKEAPRSVPDDAVDATPVEPVKAVSPAVNPRMAARARYLRAKRMVGSDAASINEILGIASANASGTNSPTAASLLPHQDAEESAGDQVLMAPEEARKKKSKRKAAHEQSLNADEDTSKENRKARRKEERAAKEAARQDRETTKKGKKKRRKDDRNRSDEEEKDESEGRKRKRKEKAPHDVPVVPMSEAASQPALPTSSDPSFDAPGGGRVSHLSVQEYLHNKLTLRRAAVVRARRQGEQGVWQRAAAAAIGAA